MADTEKYYNIRGYYNITLINDSNVLNKAKLIGIFFLLKEFLSYTKIAEFSMLDPILILYMVDLICLSQ